MKSLTQKSPLLFVLALFLAASLVLSACSVLPANASPNTNQAASTAAAQPLTPIRSGFTIEGYLVPRQSAELGFSTGGRLAEVLVKEGDMVTAGQVLARLDNHAQSEAAQATADLQVTQSQQALEDLKQNAGTAYSHALEAVSAAAQAVRDARFKLDAFTLPTALEDLTPAEAVTEMQAKYQEARSDYNQCKDANSEADCEEQKEALDIAAYNYNAAVRWMQLDANVQAARIRYDQAVQDADILKAGPDPDALEAAEAALKAARAQQVAAQANHDAAELRAPIAGVVVTITPIAGEQIAPNQVIITIADFSQWLVETDNLTELDVINIQAGQNARVVADALPEVTLSATVASISSAFAEKRGDITYTARLALENTDPRLRWGMTVAVSFEE